MLSITNSFSNMKRLNKFTNKIFHTYIHRLTRYLTISLG